MANPNKYSERTDMDQLLSAEKKSTKETRPWGKIAVVGSAVVALVVCTALTRQKLDERSDRIEDLKTAEANQEALYAASRENGTPIKTLEKVLFFSEGTKYRENSGTYNPRSVLGLESIPLTGAEVFPGNVVRTVKEDELLQVFQPLDYKDGSRQWVEFRMNEDEPTTPPRDSAEFSEKMFALYDEELKKQGKLFAECEAPYVSKGPVQSFVTEGWVLRTATGETNVATAYLIDAESSAATLNMLKCTYPQPE